MNETIINTNCDYSTPAFKSYKLNIQVGVPKLKKKKLMMNNIEYLLFLA